MECTTIDSLQSHNSHSFVHHHLYSYYNIETHSIVHPHVCRKELSVVVSNLFSSLLLWVSEQWCDGLRWWVKVCIWFDHISLHSTHANHTYQCNSLDGIVMFHPWLLGEVEMLGGWLFLHQWQACYACGQVAFFYGAKIQGCVIYLFYFDSYIGVIMSVNNRHSSFSKTKPDWHECNRA